MSTMGSERHKQFTIFNTSTNCFLCFDQIQVPFGSAISIFSLEAVLAYLDIDLSHLNSVVIVSSLQTTRDIRVNLCGECEKAVNNFSKHCEILMEQIRRELQPHLEIIQGRLGNVKDNPKIWRDYQRRIQKVADVQAQAQMKIVEELRDKMSKSIEKHSGSNTRDYLASDNIPEAPVPNVNPSEDFQLDEDPLASLLEPADVDDVKPEETDVSSLSPSIPEVEFGLEETKPEVNERIPPPPIFVETDIPSVNHKKPFEPEATHHKKKKGMPQFKVDMKYYYGQKHQCPVCEKKYTTYAIFKKHKCHLGPFTCSICQKVFKENQHLTKHMESHRKEKPFKCDACSAAYKHEVYLKAHQQLYCTKGEKNTFLCSQCPSSFNTKQLLRVHMSSHRDKTLKCPHCEKCFKTNQSLKDHVTTHSDEKPFNCHICGKFFKTRASLSLHVKNHDLPVGQKTYNGPFPCTICGKVLATKGSRRVHMMMHNEEKPVKCDHCDKTFRNKTRLRHHSVVHAKQGLIPVSEEFLKCKVCEQVFANKAHLQNHERLHTGEKPFQCGTCGKSFAQKRNLTAHEDAVHSGTTYPCSVCGRGFTTKRNLVKHEKIIHKK